MHEQSEFPDRQHHPTAAARWHLPNALLVYTDAVEPGAVTPDEMRLDWVLKEAQAAKDLKDGDAIEMVPWADRPNA